MIYPIFVFIACWGISIGGALLTWHVCLFQDIKMEEKLLSISISLLFAVPRFRQLPKPNNPPTKQTDPALHYLFRFTSFRSTAPLAPLDACWLDYAAFFFTMIVCVVLNIAM